MLNRFKRAVLVAAAIFVGATALYAGWVYMGPLANDAGLTYSTTYTADLTNSQVDQLTMMAAYSTTTYSTGSFTDGTQSTGSITVAAISDLAGKQGTNTITVLSTSSLTSATISIGGTTLTQGVHWYTQTSTNAVATSIKTGINRYATAFTATTSANVVTVSCTSSGTWCNNQTLSVSVSSLTVGAASFSGGVDNAIVAVNNLTLIQGRDWNVGASSAATATAIAAAMNASSSVSAIVTSTAPLSCASGLRCGVVVSTSVACGTSTTYSLFSSSQAALRLSGVATTNSAGQGSSAMTGGTNPGYSITTDYITIATHGFTKALPVLYTAGSVAIGGLTTQTTYFVVVADANTIGLASTSALAQAGTYIGITSSSTQTTAHTYTLAPLAFTGTPSWKWQVSNDNSNWVDLNISSVTFSTPYTASSYMWDFGTVDYRYLRLNVTGPTTGGMRFYVYGNGKSRSSR